MFLVLRSIYASIAAIFFVALDSVITILSYLIFRDPILSFKISVWCSKQLLRSLPVSFSIEGEADSAGVVLYNHTSMLDIIVLLASFTRPTFFVAKSELFRIPIFNLALKAKACAPIKRDNKQKVWALLEELSNNIKLGRSYALAPESTRYDGAALGPFRRGPFRMAIQSQANIHPILLFNVHKVLPAKGFPQSFLLSWKRSHTHIHVKFLPPISTKGLSLDDVDDLKERVYRVMQEEYENGAQKF